MKISVLPFQILSTQHPQAGLVNLPFYCELRHKFQNQTPACLSLLWAVGQLGHYDFITGLKGIYMCLHSSMSVIHNGLTT